MGADKSAVGTMNDSVGKLVSQAQMGMTFTLKASMDLEFPNRVMNRPLRLLAPMYFIHPAHTRRVGKSYREQYNMRIARGNVL